MRGILVARFFLHPFWTRPQRLVDALTTASERALWATALYAGLRRGELRALRWEHVDLVNRRINVREAMSEKDEITPPKDARRHPASADHARPAVSPSTRGMASGSPRSFRW